uniref:Uncharacterized protein n=1 Tax=Latimeria chalumnae TaxID=7897 RepID=H3ADE5_LATCH
LTDMISMIQNATTEFSLDVNHMVRQLSQISKNLKDFFLNAYTLSNDTDLIEMLIENLQVLADIPQLQSSFQSIQPLFEEVEPQHLLHAIHVVLDGIAVIEELPAKNFTEAIETVYLFTMAQWIYSSKFERQTKIDENVIRLMQLVASILDSLLEVPECFHMMVSQILLETSYDDLSLVACNILGEENLLHGYTLSIAIKHLLVEYFQEIDGMEYFGDANEEMIIYDIICFLQQFEEINSILVNISQVYSLDSEILIKLQEYWLKLSYLVTSINNDTRYCHPNQVIHSVIMLLDVINTASTQTLTENYFFYVSDIAYLLSHYNGDETEFINAAVQCLQNTTQIILSVKESAGSLSIFISLIKLLPQASKAETQTIMLLLTLVDICLNDTTEMSWIEDWWQGLESLTKELKLDSGTKELLSVIQEEAWLGVNGTFTHTNASLLLLNALNQYNISKLETVLRNVENFHQITRTISFNYTREGSYKILNILNLMCSYTKSQEIIQAFEEIVTYLEMYNHASEETGNFVSLIDDLLLNKNMTAFQNISSIFQRLVLNIIQKITSTEKQLEVQAHELTDIVEFLDKMSNSTEETLVLYSFINDLSSNRNLKIILSQVEEITKSIDEEFSLNSTQVADSVTAFADLIFV